MVDKPKTLRQTILDRLRMSWIFFRVWFITISGNCRLLSPWTRKRMKGGHSVLQEGVKVIWEPIFFVIPEVEISEFSGSLDSDFLGREWSDRQEKTF